MGFLWFGKGKIEIQLTNYNYAPGSTVEGIIIMNLKKPLEAKELTIRLYAEQKVTPAFGNNRSQSYRKIFDFKQPVDGPKVYPANQELRYPFKITVPANTASMPGGAFGGFLKSVQMLSGSMTSVKWYLQARLDVKGFDITKKVQINVA